MPGKEDSREREDEEKSRNDETDPPEDSAEGSSNSPSTEDGELGRGWSRQEVGGRDPVIEVLGQQPVPFLDTHAAKQCVVSWRTTEADTTKPGPLTSNRVK